MAEGEAGAERRANELIDSGGEGRGDAVEGFVLNAVMDNMSSNVYITDPKTDRILFMNQKMKEDFGIEHPEGAVCWQILQKDLRERCLFCPIDELSRPDAPSVIQWEEENALTGRTYTNYDSLITWLDGSLVHLQQSIDTTDWKTANIDELTDMMTRRAGKSALRATLNKAAEENRIVSVCLYDINHLKNVNDRYGHAEGDRLIRTVSRAASKAFRKDDFGFRLSGDEFVGVIHADAAETKRRIDDALAELAAVSRTQAYPYLVGFCYGIVEVLPGSDLTSTEIIARADQRMYDQKRRFHIEENERRARTEKPHVSDVEDFEYDKDSLLDALEKSTDDYLYVCNMKTGVFRYPKTMVEEFGLPGQVIENAAAIWGAKVHESDKRVFLESNQEIADGRTTSHCVEYRAINRRGEWVWLRCRGHLILDSAGAPELFAGIITNLGKKEKIDHLTGLLSKYEYEEEINRRIADDPGRRFGIMELGIDDLRHVNDLHDRTFGDEVIRITAQKIQSLLPPGASVYRLDGDEFGVILENADREALYRFYGVIDESCQSMQEFDGKRFYCALSAGCACYPEDAETYLDLAKYSGYSLEYAKSHGKRRCVCFTQDILDERARELKLVEHLRSSVENGFAGFSLCYQPQIDMRNASVTGAEALARFTCDGLGAVSPIEFIPLLEKTGLIIPVGMWVLKTAATQCRAWTELKPDFVMSVNLSYRQIDSDSLVPFIEEVLHLSGLSPKNLVIEMTESYFVSEDKPVKAVFDQIRNLGVRVAMDDFGTGYSALGMLKKSPADIVKIDRAFVAGIQASTFDATFIKFVVELCHDVGIEVCLEGVETDGELEVVSSMGLDYIQGFLFGRPYPPDEFCHRFLS
ncbi:EAL domain-containing protein [Raoultibacter phocaeensis]|uniref:EAL domain-containing protein n=1 Tax=Raoultibacter phocaeensis TaxID=2479841 RepID=UPI0015D5B353|nr:EAL domain-containing protein [Raoultibacter phocaeensis]